MKGRYLAIILVAMAALSGCAMLDDNGETDEEDSDVGETDTVEAELTEEVTFAWYGIAGESFDVEVAVENTGETETTHEATLTAAGEDVASESVTVDAGSTEQFTFRHSFADPGEYELAVGDAETTLTVYESPMELFTEGEFQRGTRVTEEEMSAEGEVIDDGLEFTVSIEESATARTNYDDETKYTLTEGTFEFFGETSEETTEEWVVDGTRYAKIEDHAEGTVTYEREPSEEFAGDDVEFGAETIQQYTTVTRTDDAYVFTIDPESSAGASDVWTALSDGDDDIPPTALTSLEMEYYLDAGLFRPVSAAGDITIEDWDGFSEFTMTFEEEHVAFDEPVDVEVPDEVLENT